MNERLKLMVKNHSHLGVVLAIGVVLVGVFFLKPWSFEAPAPVVEEAPGYAMEAAVPSVLSIPKIKLETTFEEPLGLNPDGTAAVPESYTKVGWYKNGPTPGELGPAVILGHVDSFKGPAVFFSLGQLEVGDDIFVTREDGSKAHFVVSELERNQQSEFPTVKVYGDLNYAGLRLITCSGTFVKGEQRYTHNLIVYAKLVE
jgi:sortase (surface protein transpeptidase)